MRERFEYTYIRMQADRFVALINKRGAEGWEVVSHCEPAEDTVSAILIRRRTEADSDLSSKGGE